MLEARFDPTIPANADFNNPCTLANPETSFDWYGENVYAVDDCRVMASMLRHASDELASAAGPVSLNERCAIVPDGGYRAIEASVASRMCLACANAIEAVADDAEGLCGLVAFIGP